MVDKVNGMTAAGQFLTGGLNFYTVRTTLDIRPSTVGDIQEAGQKRLDKLVETISLRAQPIILSAVTMKNEIAADLPASGGVAVDVYTLKFAIEHNKAWEVQGSPNPSLAECLNGIEGFVYELGVTTGNNVAVALVESL